MVIIFVCHLFFGENKMETEADAEFFVPFSRLNQTSLLPYYCFPRIWRDSDQRNSSIATGTHRDKNDFTTVQSSKLLK
jgi:hypothetical protein